MIIAKIDGRIQLVAFWSKGTGIKSSGVRADVPMSQPFNPLSLGIGGL